MEPWDPFICNDSYESKSSDNEENTKDDGSQSRDKVTTNNDGKDSGDDLKYPHGFTPSVINMEEVNKMVKVATINEGSHRWFNLQLMDELVKVGQTMRYNMEGCMRNIQVNIGSQGECNVETKIKSMELVTIKMLWVNSSFEYALSSSLGSLIELPLDGYAYTWAHKTANKMSKLDRFIVSKGLLALLIYLSALCLDRNLLDHHPIMVLLHLDFFTLGLTLMALTKW
ncbi:RNA-directed DNA polymerase, eukaryota [Tanacetum coccineum]|uniref:RNA-directed DNA polymerase, eukaryota n=1 Tax=Tanacetum coccineum TaxID=301880 RepID=A0ABQ5B0S5_9ASTR